MSLPVVTIDGPAGVGKSTIAGMVANELGIPYLNTGAMFRKLALELGEKGFDLNDAGLKTLAVRCVFSLDPLTSILTCNGEPIGDEIRGEAVAALASAYGKRASLRKVLAESQRRIAMETPLVAEGRDMGTAVFPDAGVKFFLDAAPKARAQRRWLQLKESGLEPDLESIELNILKRDEQDRTRSVAPLKPAENAIIIDTSSLTLPQVFEKVMNNIKKAPVFPKIMAAASCSGKYFPSGGF